MAVLHHSISFSRTQLHRLETIAEKINMLTDQLVLANSPRQLAEVARQLENASLSLNAMTAELILTFGKRQMP